jgi:acyl dehydratase
VLVDPLADTVSSAREYARITLNLAAAHRDARAGIDGRRLVYGGHTIALAQASLARVLPDLLTVLAWRSCDHLAPVFEDDLLEFEATVEDRAGDLADVTVVARAVRGNDVVDVLRWRSVILLGRAP